MMREKLNKKETSMKLSEWSDDKKVLMNGSDYIELESVGSALTSELNVCPLNVGGGIDIDNGVHLYDVSDEWYCNLSDDDLISFFEFIENTTHLIADVYVDWKTKIWSMWEEHNNILMNLDDPRM